jgi:alpha-ribazole phosphatase
MSTRLLLVRHGQTSYNHEIRFMGQRDIPLNESGREQVQAVAKRLANERPAAIYSSHLGRARETALAIQAAIPSHPEVQIDPRLTEGHFGDWEGHTYEELRQRDAERLASWEADRLNVPPPNGESLHTLAKRVQAAYDEICAAHPDDTVIITAHGGSLQVLITLALELPLEAYSKLWVSNASLSELNTHRSQVILQLLNDTSHLSGIARR